MSIFRTAETTDWNFVMNRCCWSAAHPAFALRKFSGLISSLNPSTSTRLAMSSLPHAISLFSHVFRKPFSAAEIIAKDVLGVEIGRRPIHFTGTPITLFCNSVRSARIWPPTLRLLGALSGAIRLTALACAFAWCATNGTRIPLGKLSPSVLQETFVRTECLGLFIPGPILRIKLGTATDARLFN